MVYLSRTDFVLQTSKSHVDSLPETEPNKAILGVFLTFLVCVSFYSEMELKITEIVKRRITIGSDTKLANFIANTQKTMLGRLNKSDLASCAGQFGIDAKNQFNAAVSEQDVTLYSNLITQRHKVAHNEDGTPSDWTTATLSLSDVEAGLKAAERLLKAFEDSIQ